MDVCINWYSQLTITFSKFEMYDSFSTGQDLKLLWLFFHYEN